MDKHLPLTTPQKPPDTDASDLPAWRVAEISSEIQNQAATLLGKILFAFGELERDLALCLVWVREGRELETLTKQFENRPFNDKLECLEKFAKSDFASDSEQYIAYSNWFVRADAVRMIRNDLAHGRWWFDPYRNCAFNVSGIPTSPKQVERPYTIDGLNGFLQVICQLQVDLNAL